MSFVELLALLAVLGAVLFLTLMVLVSLPHSPIRDLLVQIIGWLFAAFCGVYCIAPDVMPIWIFGPVGLLDDCIALGAGIASAAAAYNAGAQSYE